MEGRGTGREIERDGEKWEVDGQKREAERGVVSVTLNGFGLGQAPS